jgi:hypothetical protein
MTKAATAPRPFLISKDEAGLYRVTIRVTRYNSQNFPLVTATLIDETFKSATAARTYIRTEYKAAANDISVS